KVFLGVPPYRLYVDMIYSIFGFIYPKYLYSPQVLSTFISLVEILLLPVTILLFGISLVTTAFAPIITSLPIVTGPPTTAPAATTTLLPIIGSFCTIPVLVVFVFLKLPPIVAYCPMFT